MKIKIVGAGWTNFNGYFGVTEFVDGVSVHEVSAMEAQRLGAVVAIETLEGVNPSAAQLIVDSRAEPLPHASTPVVEVVEIIKPVMSLTAEELAEIADKGGIRALRDVAEPFGVRGKAIVEIIQELLALAPAKVAVAPVEAADPVETAPE